MAKTFEWQEICQITKMDPVQGKFWATAALGGVKDRAGERLNYLKSKPNFEAIVKSQSAATGGDSKFPLRLQHDDKFCAGRIDVMNFDDGKQSIDVEGTVVHPIAKMLLAEKCLTGVSIGGACTKSRLADGSVEYVAIPQEISVVDRPCLAEATFQMVKVDGTVEMCKFAGIETSQSLIETLLKATQSTMSAETEKALTEKIDSLEKTVNTYFELAKQAAEQKSVLEKSELSKPNTEVTMNKEFKDFTPDELAKAHKSAMDHLGMAKAAHAAHVAEANKANDAAHAEVCGHLDNCAKAMGVETVAMPSTKTVATTDLNKSADKSATDQPAKPAKSQDEMITETVTAALNKAFGIEPEKELTLEEKVAKAVNAALEPILAKTAPNAARPVFGAKPSAEEKPLTDAERADLAKRAAAGDRDAVTAMFKSQSAQQLNQRQA
jgi:hypothetical protein